MKKQCIRLLSVIPLVVLVFTSCNKVTDNNSLNPQPALNTQSSLIWTNTTITHGADLQTGTGVTLPCAGGGPICKIVTTVSEPFIVPLEDPDETWGGIGIDDNENIVIRFWKEEMHSTWQGYFSDNTVSLPQDVIISSEMASAIGINNALLNGDGTYTIIAADYEYSEDEQFYYVVF